MKICGKKLFTILLIACLLVPSVPWTMRAEAALSGTTYYVDSVNGSDDASGRSENTPWKTLDKVNDTIFSPGDRILLKSGSVFKGQLYPKGSGRAGAPIQIDKYGSDQKPLIIPDGRNETIVTLYNQQYWEISNLEISGLNNASIRYAVNIIGRDCGTLNHIYLRNNYIHDVAGNLSTKLSGGIFFSVKGTSIKTNFNDIRIENNTLRHVDRTGITLDAYLSWENKLLTEYEPGVWYPSTGVEIRGNFIDDIGGDGIVMKNCKGGIVEYNTAKNCNARATDANVAIWVFNSDDCVMQYNEAYNTRYTHDGEGFDVDSFSERTLVQYNYSHDNEGGFMLICAPGDEGTGTKGYYTKDTTIRYNISQNDGNLGIIFSGNSIDTKVYNNTFYMGEGTSTTILDSFNWGAWPDQILFANNLIYNLGTGEYLLGEMTNLTVTNNLMYGNHPMSEPADEGKILADPMLVAPGSGGYGIHTLDGYMLQEGSPALGTGIAIDGSCEKDYYGIAVNQKMPNIGAYGGTAVSQWNKKGTSDIEAERIQYVYPVYAKTDINKQVQLPEFIPVRLDSGRDELVQVTWEDTGVYEKEGAYTIQGEIVSAGVQVVCDLTVQKPEVDVFEKILVTNNIPQWTSEDNKNASYIDPISYSGKYCLTQYDRTPFETRVYQELDSLENGTYTFSAYVNSNGTQKRAEIIVESDQEYKASIEKTDRFERIEIKDIQVTDGRCRITIASDGIAESYLKVDETALVKDDSLGVNCIRNNGFDIFNVDAIMDSETKESFAVRGTPVIDGKIDDIWENAVIVDVDTRNFTYVSGNKTTVSAVARLMWDNDYLYVLAQVKDPVVSYSNETTAYFRDSVEIVMDERNVKEGRYIPHNETCGQWRVGAKGDDLSGYGSSYTKAGSRFVGETALTENGYLVEMAVPFTELIPSLGAKIGFEMQINDDNGSGSRTGIVCWNSATGESWQYTDVLGTVTLLNDKSQVEVYAGTDGNEPAQQEKPSIEEKKDYSRYTAWVFAAAVLLLCMVCVNLLLLLKRGKKKNKVGSP